MPVRPRARLVVPVLALALLAGCSGDDKKKSAQDATAPQLVQAGLAAVQQGNDDAAFSAFTQAAKKDPNNVYAHYNLGYLYQKRGNTQQALQEYGLALQANPKYVPALYNSATIYGATNPQLAITTYQQVLKLQPKAPTTYLNLGLLEAKLGLFDQARKDFDMALKQDGSLVTSIPKDVFKASPVPSPASGG